MEYKTILGVAVAATVSGLAPPANATYYSATLTQVLQYSNGALSGSVQTITSSTATFAYDDVTRVITQTGGSFNARVTTAPTTTLYRTLITGLLMGNGGVTSAASYVCAEGNFGAGVGASLCGNYQFGANLLNESTTTWGPGTAASRTLGGDDAAAGDQQSIATLHGMNTISWVGTALVLSNRTCTLTCTTTAGGFNNGQRWTFSAGPTGPLSPLPVPVPASAWLFGSALGAMGWLRRKA